MQRIRICLRMQGKRVQSLAQKISCAVEQLSLCTTILSLSSRAQVLTPEAHASRPWAPQREKPRNGSNKPTRCKRVALRTAMKTQRNQKTLKNKTKPTVKD